MQKQPQEDLLGGVGSVLLVIQKPETNSPHPGPKPFHQRDKGRAVRTFSGGLGGKLFVGAMNQVNGHGCQRIPFAVNLQRLDADSGIFVTNGLLHASDR